MVKKTDGPRFCFIFGDVMRHLRKNAGISKGKMAATLGLSVPKYISVEEGFREIGAYEILLFANSVNVSVGEIFDMACEHAYVEV